MKKYDIDHTITENDTAILRYLQATNMVPQQFADGLFVKFCKAEEVYDESMLNNVFREGMNAFLRHRLRSYWSTAPQVDSTDIKFQVESLLSLRIEPKKSTATNFLWINLEILYHWKP